MEKDVERGMSVQGEGREEVEREGGREGVQGGWSGVEEGKREIKHNALQCVSRTVISRVSWRHFFSYTCSSG